MVLPPKKPQSAERARSSSKASKQNKQIKLRITLAKNNANVRGANSINNSANCRSEDAHESVQPLRPRPQHSSARAYNRRACPRRRRTNNARGPGGRFLGLGSRKLPARKAHYVTRQLVLLNQVLRRSPRLLKEDEGSCFSCASVRARPNWPNLLARLLPRGRVRPPDAPRAPCLAMLARCAGR